MGFFIDIIIIIIIKTTCNVLLMQNVLASLFFILLLTLLWYFASLYYLFFNICFFLSTNMKGDFPGYRGKYRILWPFGVTVSSFCCLLIFQVAKLSFSSKIRSFLCLYCQHSILFTPLSNIFIVGNWLLSQWYIKLSRLTLVFCR